MWARNLRKFIAKQSGKYQLVLRIDSSDRGFSALAGANRDKE
jgi:hypothetical protein